MSDELDMALSKQKRANIMFSMAKGVFITYITIILTVIAVQGVVLGISSQNTIDLIRASQVANQHAGISNHELTRKYIRCLVEVLSLPAEQSTSLAFDNCNTDSVTSPNTDPNTSTIAPPVTPNK